MNKELITVNAEHQLKIAELTELNRDISHLLESIDVATIYLDRNGSNWRSKCESISGIRSGWLRCPATARPTT